MSPKVPLNSGELRLGLFLSVHGRFGTAIVSAYRVASLEIPLPRFDIERAEETISFDRSAGTFQGSAGKAGYGLQTEEPHQFLGVVAVHRLVFRQDSWARLR